MSVFIRAWIFWRSSTISASMPRSRVARDFPAKWRRYRANTKFAWVPRPGPRVEACAGAPPGTCYPQNVTVMDSKGGSARVSAQRPIAFDEYARSFGAAGESDDGDLEVGALLVAQDGYPGLIVEEYLRKLDALTIG